MSPLFYIGIGITIPCAGLLMFEFGRELPRAIGQVRCERSTGVPLRFSCLRPFFWYLFVRPGFRLGKHYEPDPSKAYEQGGQ